MATKKKVIQGGVDVQTASGVSALVVDETTGAVTAGVNTTHTIGNTSTDATTVVEIKTGGTNQSLGIKGYPKGTGVMYISNLTNGASTEFYTSVSTAMDTKVASCSSAGAWTWGPSAHTGLTHTAAGNFNITARGDTSATDIQPTFLMLAKGNATTFIGASLVTDSGSNYGVTFDVRLSSAAALATRPAFKFQNYGTTLATCSNAGAWAKPGGGSWADSSDERLKKNITSLQSGLPIILALRPVRYVWRDENVSPLRPTVHFIAQEVEQVNPKWVIAGDTERITENGKEIEIEKCKQVSLDSSFNAYLVKALQEQQAMIEELKAEVALLKAK